MGSKIHFFTMFIVVFIVINNLQCHVKGPNIRNYEVPTTTVNFPEHIERVKQFTGGYSGAEVFQAIDHSDNDTVILLKGGNYINSLKKEAKNLEYVKTLDSPYFQKIIRSFQASVQNRLQFFILTDFIQGSHYDNYDLNKGTKKVNFMF